MRISLTKLMKFVPIGKAAKLAVTAAKFAKGGISPEEAEVLRDLVIELIADIAERRGDEAAHAFVAEIGPLLDALEGS